MDREEARKKVIERYQRARENRSWRFTSMKFLESYKVLDEIKLRIDGKDWREAMPELKEMVAAMREEIEEGINILMRGRAISEEEEREVLAGKRAVVVKDGKVTTEKVPEWKTFNTHAKKYIDDNRQVWLFHRGTRRFWKQEDFKAIKEYTVYRTPQGKIITERGIYSMENYDERVPDYSMYPDKLNELWVYVHTPKEAWIAQDADIYPIVNALQNQHPLKPFTHYYDDSQRWSTATWEYLGAKFTAEVREAGNTRSGYAIYVQGEMNGIRASQRATFDALQSDIRTALEEILRVSKKILTKIQGKTQKAEEKEKPTAKRKKEKKRQSQEDALNAALIDRENTVVRREIHTYNVFVRGTPIVFMVRKHEETGIYIGTMEGEMEMPKVVLAASKKMRDTEALLKVACRRVNEKYEDTDVPITLIAKEVMAAMREGMAALLAKQEIDPKSVIYMTDEQKIKTEWNIGRVLG